MEVKIGKNSVWQYLPCIFGYFQWSLIANKENLVFYAFFSILTLLWIIAMILGIRSTFGNDKK